MPRFPRLLMLALLLPSLAVTACDSGPELPQAPFSADGEYLPPAAGPGAVADTQSPIPDVPRPIGFKAVPSRCTKVTMQGQARQVRHVYQGRGEAAEVVLMYRQQLPAHDWSFEDADHDEDGGTVMRYAKGPERLRVRVVEHGTLSTIINILVEIKARNGPQSAPTGERVAGQQMTSDQQ